MPFFSVIIPLFNKEKFIEATLKSVLIQTFIDFEILIINDGSTDNSAEIIKGFDDPRIRYFYKENEGVSSARNTGIKNAKAKFIAFLDADDYWYPDFLEEMFKNIQSYPQEKVFSAAIEIETSKKVIPASYSILKTNHCEIVNYFNASSKETVICTSCAVFHKSIFSETGTFDLKIKSGQDTDMWIRIGMNYPVVFSWKILARYIYDEKSLSKNKNYLNQKINFSKFEEQEKTNLSLKKFLDLNRFSLAIKSKLIADDDNFNTYSKAIDQKNISLKKRILLIMPSVILKPLINLKLILVNNGFGNSVFK
ncbi:glycosyltransferase family 2 protein [Flavobacterium sp. LS2P90]|uniref:Glycosyltransferase family 2 protein n=1 Tax=Flavobacterium xylosi TaxID=3230415 RepID=A0ABW6I0H8_9FLAO